LLIHGMNKLFSELTKLTLPGLLAIGKSLIHTCIQQRPNSHLVPMSATGKMPVPQEHLVFVEQASCLFLRMVQHLTTNLIAKHLHLNS